MAVREKTLNWIEPTNSRRGARDKTPGVIVSLNTQAETNDGKKKWPYARITANKAFIEKFYNSSKVQKIAIAVGGNGVIFDPNPKANIPSFKFTKARIINDHGLVEKILESFDKDISKQGLISMKLIAKPFGTNDGRSLYQLVKD